MATTDHTAATPATYYALTDHLGTVHAFADASGDIAESYAYDAWGNVLAVYDASGSPIPASALGNRYLFQGREYSWASGLYHFRARWYDPQTGRWLSNDPIGISGGLNQYVFCGNDPVNKLDVFGCLWESVEQAIRAGLGNVFKLPEADKWEYSFNLYRTQEGLFGYGPYRTDKDPLSVQTPVIFEIQGKYFTEDCEGKKHEYMGNVHTHRRDAAQPSTGDMERTAVKGALGGKPEYIGNKWGDIWKFDPDTKLWSELIRKEIK